MGNHHSSGRYDKDTVIRHLWKALGAIPVFPVNPNLAPLRVLTKHRDGYHDVGSVASLSKAGDHKKWLQDILNPSMFQILARRGKKYFPPIQSVGKQSYTISDYHYAIAKLLVGEANAAAWFKRATSIEVHIPECWVREFNIENWDEMLEHFHPDMKNKSILGDPDRYGKRKLFIVQKVVLVSHIKITAQHKTGAGLNLKTPPVSPGAGVHAEVSFCGSDTVEFTLSATKKNQRLPIAFSGFSYTYDKFGVRDSKYGKETRTQSDAAGASSSHHEDVEEDVDEDGDEDTPANDADMGDFLEEDDWCISIISSHEPEEGADDPAPPSPAGSPPRDLEDMN